MVHLQICKIVINYIFALFSMPNSCKRLWLYRGFHKCVFPSKPQRQKQIRRDCDTYRKKTKNQLQTNVLYNKYSRHNQISGEQFIDKRGYNQLPPLTQSWFLAKNQFKFGWRIAIQHLLRCFNPTVFPYFRSPPKTFFSQS